MVLQLCGRVCRRLSLVKPFTKVKGFLFYWNDLFWQSPRFVSFLYGTPAFEKVGVLLFIGTTCSGKALGSSPFFMEPQLEKVGVLLFIDATQFSATAGRVVATDGRQGCLLYTGFGFYCKYGDEFSNYFFIYLGLIS